MKRNRLRIMGICLLVCGLFILSLFAYKKISREVYLQNLLKENIVLEIPSLNIKVPVLEGTDSETLAVAAGHFQGTGELGHNSTIYAEIFNDLDQIQIGAEMDLMDTDAEKTCYTYVVAEYKVVDPEDVAVLDDYGDDRLTVISCTDDGTQRQVVVGMLK